MACTVGREGAATTHHRQRAVRELVKIEGDFTEDIRQIYRDVATITLCPFALPQVGGDFDHFFYFSTNGRVQFNVTHDYLYCTRAGVSVVLRTTI
jgi:hypothetical protein